MAFLSRVVGYSFGDRVRDSWLKLRVELLRWLGHLLYLSSICIGCPLAPLLGGVPGVSHREKTPGNTLAILK